MRLTRVNFSLDRYIARVREINNQIENLTDQYRRNPARNKNLLDRIHKLEIEKQTLAEAYTFNEKNMSKM